MVYQNLIKQRLNIYFVSFTLTLACAGYSLIGVAVERESDKESASRHENVTALTTMYESSHGNLLPAEPGTSRDGTRLELSLEISRYFEIQDWWLIGTEINAEVDRIDAGLGHRVENQQFIELEQLWAGWSSADSWLESIRIGRFAIEDDRHWWWDENVNGISSSFSLGDSSLSLIAASADKSPSTDDRVVDEEDRSILWGLAQLEQEFESIDSVSIYYAHKDDRSSRYLVGQQVVEPHFDERDDELNWIGLGLEKNWSLGDVGNFALQLDAARLDGQSLVSELGEQATVTTTSKQSISGWGYDLLLTWSPEFWQGSAISLGYASGSKDFRQTGLQNNDNEFPAHGELFEPELANLDIVTAGLRVPLNHRASVNFQYNQFRRGSLANEEIEGDIEFEIFAPERDIGSEIDITLDYLFSDLLGIRLAVAQFRAGDGIVAGQDRKIDKISFELEFEF